MGAAEDRLEVAEAEAFETFGLDTRVSFHEVGDPKVRLRVVESGEGPPLVLLHGAASTASSWAPLMAKLPGRRLVALDLFGWGLSGSFDHRAVDLRPYAVGALSELFDRLGIASAPVIGCSLGGMYGLWLTLDAPSRVQRLVLMGVPAVALPGVRGNLSMAAASVRGVGAVVLRIPAPWKALTRLLLAGALGRDTVENAPDVLMNAAHEARRMPSFRVAFPSLMQVILRLRKPSAQLRLSDEELAQVDRPVLFVWGDRDLFAKPEAGHRAAEHMPNAKVEVVHGGHHPWWDEPERCAALVRAFLPVGEPR